MEGEQVEEMEEQWKIQESKLKKKYVWRGKVLGNYVSEMKSIT